jgi:hypothetical protein
VRRDFEGIEMISIELGRKKTYYTPVMSVIHCAFTGSIYYIPTANAVVFTTTHKNTTLHVISSSNTKYFA